MRKFLAILLSAVTVLTLAFAGVSAADATVINTAEEFAAMAADGNYKLGADLTISATYATAFTGTLDGDGHKITTTVPIFDTLQGATVKNLTIEGSVESTSNAGALSINGKGGFTLTDCVNKANVSSSKAGAYVGGFIGAVNTGAGTATAFEYNTITNCTNYGRIHAGSEKPRIGGITGNNAKYAYTTFTNCVNYGDLDLSQDEGKTALAATPYAGGISASSFDGKFVNCLNKGNITSTVGTDMGGICGRIIPSTQGADHSVTFESCTNEGNLTDCGRAVGGIGGYVGTKVTGAAYAVHTFTKCVNKGTISQTGDGNEAGGIAGYVYGQDSKDSEGQTKASAYQHAEFVSCVNYGAITGSGAVWVSQIVAYTNTYDTVIKDCVGLGSVATGDVCRAVLVGLSNSNSTIYQISGVTLKTGDGTAYFSYASDDANAANRIAIADRPANMVELKSEADCTAAVAALGEIGYVAPPAPADPEPETPVTGDSYAILAVVAIVSVLGMGIALKARKD